MFKSRVKSGHIATERNTFQTWDQVLKPHILLRNCHPICQQLRKTARGSWTPVASVPKINGLVAEHFYQKPSVFVRFMNLLYTIFLASSIRVDLKMPPEPILETDQILEGTAATEICRWAGCREWAEKTPGMQISVEKLVPAS